MKPLHRSGPLALIGMLLTLQASAALADLPSAFAGRRQTGGMHGPCNSRLLVHLVPPDSRYAPAASGLVGLLMEATNHPFPVAIQFSDTPRDAGDPLRLLPPDPEAGITLLHAPGPQRPLLWSSGYRCAEDSSSDPFAGEMFFPAMTLLMAEQRPQEGSFRSNLEQLRRHCGKRVPRDWLIVAFDLGDLFREELPATVPVHCP